MRPLLGPAEPATVPAWPVAAFRVVFALVALRDAFELFRHRRLLWPPGFHSDLFTPAPWLLALWAVALVFLLLGLWTRPAAAVNLAVTVAVQLPSLLGDASSFYSSSADSFLILGAWLLLILPAGQVWSLDHLRRGGDRLVGGWVRLVGAVLLCTIYFDSGVRKLGSPMWRSGLGIWSPASLPGLPLRRLPWLDNHKLMLVLGLGTILWEVLFPFAWFLVPRLRVAAWVTGFAFHIGALVYYPFHTFSLMLIAMHVLATPLPASARRVGARRGLVVAVLAGWMLLRLVLLAPVGAPPTALRARLVTKASQAVAIFGISTYGVFDDALFDRQAYEVDVVWRDGERCSAIPVHSPEGYNSTGLTDRPWERWFKITQAPRSPLSTSEADLIAWARSTGRDPAGATVIARSWPTALTTWHDGLLGDRLAQPWYEIGRLGAGVVWTATDRSDTFGGQVLASLALHGVEVDRRACA